MEEIFQKGTLDYLIVTLVLTYRELVVLDTTSQLCSALRVSCNIV